MCASLHIVCDVCFGVNGSNTAETFLFLFEFPCIITLYYIKNYQDATLAVF